MIKYASHNFINNVLCLGIPNNKVTTNLLLLNQSTEQVIASTALIKLGFSTKLIFLVLLFL
jgi:hypothetical protein